MAVDVDVDIAAWEGVGSSVQPVVVGKNAPVRAYSVDVVVVAVVVVDADLAAELPYHEKKTIALELEEDKRSEDA